MDAVGAGKDWRESILSPPSSEEDESETTLDDEEEGGAEELAALAGFLASLSSLQSSGRVLVLTK